MKVEEGEMACNDCKGTGNIEFNADVLITCIKCQGAGKVDWIENIVGKKLLERIPTQKAIKAYINAKSKN